MDRSGKRARYNLPRFARYQIGLEQGTKNHFSKRESEQSNKNKSFLKATVSANPLANFSVAYLAAMKESKQISDVVYPPLQTMKNSLYDIRSRENPSAK